MLEIILIMLLGIILGFVLKDKKRLVNYASKLTSLSIFLLLLLLGVKVGGNDLIMSNIGQIGFQSLLITIAALLGSMITAYYTYKWFFQDKNEEVKNEK